MDGAKLAGLCSFSAGVAGWQDGLSHPISVWGIAQQADHALYQAKAQGKGWVAVQAFSE